MHKMRMRLSKVLMNGLVYFVDHFEERVVHDSILKAAFTGLLVVCHQSWCNTELAVCSDI